MSDLRTLLEARTCRAESGCLLWAGAKSSNGYGRITKNRKSVSAHRTAYELFNGPIPPGKFVMHTCDTPLCCEPSHLVLGNPSDNTLDALNKGRLRPNGSKLTHAMAATIRAQSSAGLSPRVLAEKWGVSGEMIWGILSGRYWKVAA